MTERADLEQFIGSTFRSVWALELLCMLRKRDGERLSHSEMVEGLRASDTIVSQSLAMLSAAGLVLVDQGGSATYRPASDDLAALVEQTDQFYTTSPNSVRRIIARSWNPGLTAFADSFKLWKDEK
jgi:DNA-binding FadR family transcriptional regulator